MKREALLLLVSLTAARTNGGAADPVLAQAAADAKQAQRAEHGATEVARIDRGVDQVLRCWRPEDGDATALSRASSSPSSE